MKLNIYNKSLERIAIIGDRFVSCYWSEGYNTVENFCLELIATKEYKQKINVDYFVGREDRKTLMVITSVEIKDGTIVATGKQATAILGDSAFIGSIPAGNTVDETIKMAYNNSEKFPGLEFVDGDGTDEFAELVESGSVLDISRDVCQETDTGFRVERNGKSLVFSTYKPQAKENLVFSEKFGNLSVDSVSSSVADFKNHAIVVGEFSDGSTIRVDVDLSNGDRKRQVVVDANVIAKRQDESNEEIKEKLYARGLDVLLEKTKVFKCAFRPYEKDFGRKYDLGDILTVHLADYGIKLESRVKKFTQKSQKNKTTTTVEVGEIVIKR